MARNYGRFTTSIWRDKDFTGLTRSQQGVYFMLCTQPEVTAAGTLPLTLRRWANTAAGETVETLRDELKALEDAGHITVDEDTEELLVVKFIKFDQGWYNEKRWPLVDASLTAIASVHIRDNVVDELVRLTLSPCPSTELKPGQWDKAVQRAQQWVRDRVPHKASGFDRSGYVSKWGTDPTPETSLQEGEPRPVAAKADDPLSDFCLEHQPDGADGPCGNCATRRTANAAKARAKLEAEVAVKKAAAEARKACQFCNDQGVREHPTTGRPLGRCNHEPLESVAS